jgi:HEAT repeat protein
MALSRKSSPAVRSFASEELAGRIATDETARAEITKLLASQEPAGIRSAAVRGLTNTRSPQTVELLRTALYRGDEASAPAASGLAKIGSPQAIGILKDAVVNAQGEGMVAAVLGISEIVDGCPDCREYLLGLHETHKEAAVRDMIGIILELDVKHEH